MRTRKKNVSHVSTRFLCKCFVLLAIQLAITSLLFAQPQSWRGIAPLHTTRKQVEKLLGRPSLVNGVASYNFENEKVEVRYSKYRCGDPRNLDRWNIPPGTVLSVRISPQRQTQIADLHLDLSKF